MGINWATAMNNFNIQRSDADYTKAVDDLLRFYRRLDEAVGSLPAISIRPFFKAFVAGFIFPFAFIADIVLIFQINLVILVRNLFPGRWSFVSFSYRYFKTAASWVWNGECAVPLIVIRPLTRYLLRWHFRGRLVELRSRLIEDTGFSEEAAKAPLAK
jgi:hypothetical protein